MIYQIFFWILLIGGYYYLNTNATNPFTSEKVRKQYVYFVCIVLILQSALRHVAVGADTYNYQNTFEEISLISWGDIWHNFYTVYVLGEGKDAGYAVLQKVFHWFSDDYRIYLFAVAIFFFSAFGRLLYHFTDNIREVFIAVCTYLLLFYSFFSITGIRQTIAVTCSIYSFFAMLNRKYVAFILWGIPAFFIHKSASMILFIPILFWFPWRTWLNRSVVILFIIAALNRDYLVRATREMAEYEMFYVNRLPYAQMIFFFVFTIFIAYSVRFFPKKHIIQNLYNVYIPTFIMIPLLGWDSLFMREVLFFSIYSCVLIPKSLRFSFTLSSPVVTVYVILCFAYHVLQNDYAFFWQEMALGANYQ